jgi:carbon storage regulator
VSGLAITRKAGQSFQIGDDITVYVSAIRGNQVRLTIDAPRELQILRDDAICREAPAIPAPAEVSGG